MLNNPLFSLKIQKFPAACKYAAYLYKDLLFRELIRTYGPTDHFGDIFDVRNFGVSEPQPPKIRSIKRVTLSSRYNWAFFYHAFDLCDGFFLKVISRRNFEHAVRCLRYFHQL